jgi:hypothetical protein
MGNYINDITYNPNNVSGTDKLSTGHSDVHNDDQKAIAELVDNQSILDDALAQKVDEALPDRVDKLEEIVHILAQGLEATFWIVASGNQALSDGEIWPVGPNGLADNWEDVTDIQFSTVTQSHGAHDGRPFSVSTLLTGEVIRLTEASVDAVINPADGYMVGVVTAIDPTNNSVAVDVQYASGSPVAGEFAVAELFPPAEEIDLSEYATMTWSQSQFSLIGHGHTEYSTTGHNHNNDYAGKSHNHDSDYASDSHGHSEYWTPTDATHTVSGIAKLGQLYQTSSSSGMAVGQMWYDNGTIKVRES